VRPYVRKRDRLVKAPSAKQRAGADRIKRFREVVKVEEANPSSSWWLGLTREQLQVAAAEQERRINYSRCGRVRDPKFSD
jgi:hypothetical protein